MRREGGKRKGRGREGTEKPQTKTACVGLTRMNPLKIHCTRGAGIPNAAHVWVTMSPELRLIVPGSSHGPSGKSVIVGAAGETGRVGRTREKYSKVLPSLYDLYQHYAAKIGINILL